ncbi:12698_t:CDS:2 [Ambispora gerdemannii]|uniref:12698_t:CDS:1 n=1 Tax=Ambispora gerdemannii TaxID=144530 RepID=A0A9N9CIK4_9GLOM|nr:12698_t:CDS:2 [Ambispora gerdemannii]
MEESLAKLILEIPLDVPLGLILQKNHEKLQEVGILTNTSVHFAENHNNPRVVVSPSRKPPSTTREQMEDARKQIECLFENSMRKMHHIKIPTPIYHSHANFVEDLLSPKLRKISDKHRIDVMPRIYKNEAYVIFIKKRKDPLSVIDQTKKEVGQFLARFQSIYAEPKITEPIDLSISFNQDILSPSEFKNQFQKEIYNIENKTNTIIEYEYSYNGKPRILIKAVEFSSNIQAKKYEAHQLIKQLLNLALKRKNESNLKNQNASNEEPEITRQPQKPTRSDSFASNASLGSSVKENTHNLEASLDETKLEFDIKSKEYIKKVSNSSEFNMLFNQSSHEFLAKWDRFSAQWIHSGYYNQFESLFGSK